MMRLIILAAGSGRRLLPLTKDKPKSLLQLTNKSTILDYQINNAITSGLFSDIVIITGYKSKQIRDKVNKITKIPISIIYNPFYDKSDNFISLWTAHHLFTESDFVITNGDNIYKEDVFTKINTNTKNKIQLTITVKSKYDSDDMKVSLNTDGDITHVSKNIPDKKINAESVGLAIIKGEKNRTLFRDKILQLVEDKTYLGKYWLEIFNSLIADKITIFSKEIKKDDWHEIDFHPDITILKDMILNKIF
jgi:choline kinase